MSQVDLAQRQAAAAKLSTLASAATTLNEHTSERVEKLFDDLAVANAFSKQRNPWY